MKTDDKGHIPKVRVAVLGKSNVGKSGNTKIPKAAKHNVGCVKSLTALCSLGINNQKKDIETFSVCSIALTVRYLTRRYIGEYRSNTDLLYRQTLTVNNSPLDVEIVDVCSCDMSLFPEEAIYWADACVIVYDITSKSSMHHAQQLLQCVQQLRSQIPLVLLGNKSDLEHLREVEEIDGRTTAVQQGCQFYEVSVAENSTAIYTAFDMVLTDCRQLQATQKTRKFSVSKMIGTLIGSGNGKVIPNTNQGGTVVVCHKSDLYKSRVLKRRQNFSATASL